LLSLSVRGIDYMHDRSWQVLGSEERDSDTHANHASASHHEN
jgi:hypothetical protein